MSKEFVQKIGEPFMQERNEFSSELIGTGLGLYIVKKNCRCDGIYHENRK